MFFLLRFFTIVILFITLISAQNLTGTNTVQLKGPANGEQVNMAKSGARAQFRSAICQWLISYHEYKIDTLDLLSTLYIESLTDTCISRGKEESSFKGKELTIMYSISDAAANEALDAFNKASEETIQKYWSDMIAAKGNKNVADYFEAALKAYCYSYCHPGEPVRVPGADSLTIRDESQKAVQFLFNSMQIQSSDMILKGRIGRVVEDAPTITARIDTVPIHGMYFCGYMQSGSNYYYASTDDNGQLSLKNLTTPLVSNGALFYMTPDIGKMIGAPISITPNNLKIRLKDGLTQSFMFKITQPTYTLEYRIKSDQAVNLPLEFKNSDALKKYLKDSCYIIESKSGLPPDFMITIEAGVSNAAIDITDEMGLKLNADITVKGLSLETPKTETSKIEHIQRYGKHTDIPYGLFLWDMNTLLKHNLRSILNKL